MIWFELMMERGEEKRREVDDDDDDDDVVDGVWMFTQLSQQWAVLCAGV